MHRTCYEHWKHHDYFESVLLKYRELWNTRPQNLRLAVEEIKALSDEERERFWREVDQWSLRAFQELQEFARTSPL